MLSVVLHRSKNDDWSSCFEDLKKRLTVGLDCEMRKAKRREYS